MPCSPDYERLTAVAPDRDKVGAGASLLLAPCSCGDPEHGWTAAVYPDRFFNQDGDQPHI